MYHDRDARASTSHELCLKYLKYHSALTQHDFVPTHNIDRSAQSAGAIMSE